MTDDFIIEEREKDGLIYQLVKLDPRDVNSYAILRASKKRPTQFVTAQGFKTLEKAVHVFHHMTKKGEKE